MKKIELDFDDQTNIHIDYKLYDGTNIIKEFDGIWIFESDCELDRNYLMKVGLTKKGHILDYVQQKSTGLAVFKVSKDFYGFKSDEVGADYLIANIKVMCAAFIYSCNKHHVSNPL